MKWSSLVSAASFSIAQATVKLQCENYCEAEVERDSVLEKVLKSWYFDTLFVNGLLNDIESHETHEMCSQQVCLLYHVIRTKLRRRNNDDELFGVVR